MEHAEHPHAAPSGGARPHRTPTASSIRWASISRSGRCCSCSARRPTWSTTSTSQGLLRWSLIVVFMLLKAGLIVTVFMHMLWERLALVYAILVPPLLLIVLLGIGALEADYTFLSRGVFFAPASRATAAAH